MRRPPPAGALLGLCLAGCVAIPFDAPPGRGAGEGAVRLEPDRVKAAEEVRLRIVFTAGPSGLVQGGGFRIQLPVDPVFPHVGFTPPHIGSHARRGHLSCSTDTPAGLGPQTRAEVGEAGEARCLLQGGGLAEGDELVMSYWGLAPRAAGSYLLNVESRFSGGSGGLPLADPVSLRVGPREAWSLSVLLPGLVEAGSPALLTLVALDRFGNRAQGYEGKVEVEAPDRTRVHRFDREQEGIALIAGLVFDRPGFHRVDVREIEGPEGPAIQARSNPVRVVPAGDRRLEGGARVLWGDLHMHTGDGAGGRGFARDWRRAGDHRGNLTRQDGVYLNARRTARLDFAAITEHAVSGYEDAAWEETLDRAARHDAPPRFITLPGYQWRDLLVFLPGPRGPLVRGDERRSDDQVELFARLEEEGAGQTVVLQASRCDDPPDSLDPRPAVGSGGHWGRAGDASRTGLEPSPGGLVAVITTRSDRQGVLDALREGRWWATSGPRIHLDLRLAGNGLDVEAAGTEELVSAELVILEGGYRRVVPLLAQPARDLMVTVPAVSGEGACHLRVAQADGGWARSAPLRLGAAGASR